MKDGRLFSSHHLTLLVEIPMKKNPVMISPFLKKCPSILGKIIPSTRSRIAVLSDESSAIIVHSLVPADSTYRVISQNGDRTLFERDSSPQSAPKVTPTSFWHLQPSTCNNVSTSRRKLVRESQSGMRDVRGKTTDDQISTRRLVRGPESHNPKLIFE